jgi:tryptophanyl-tRNA synthetase
VNKERVLSGMRATGAMHIGHYHGALKNWIKLQSQYECYYFVADWHALTSHYDDPRIIASSTIDMVTDWLACGLDPNQSTIFLQSRVPEHAELSLLLGMMTPLGWLERVPTYKEQQANMQDKDLTTYGFLGYPVMQAADILVYGAHHVPVGEDQVSHLELTREIARRFNHIYGREPDFDLLVAAAQKKLSGKDNKRYNELRKAYQEQGQAEALSFVESLLQSAGSLSADDSARLLGNITGARRNLLVEPNVMLTATSKITGLDGRKMSKSYGNAISLREPPESVTKKIKQMPTDPARARRTDPGDPEKCPVWNLHQVYSTEATKAWVVAGCKSAGIGCLECKQPVIDAVLAEQQPIFEKAQHYLDHPNEVKDILRDGCARARKTTGETMKVVRNAMGLADIE